MQPSNLHDIILWNSYYCQKDQWSYSNSWQCLKESQFRRTLYVWFCYLYFLY